MPHHSPAAKEIVGNSPTMMALLQTLDRVAANDCCILIEGESGTGKELLARRLHERSPRSQSPFIPVNCAGLTESLFESQFFGHVRGSFTGAEQTMLGMVRTADSGTLFLDEIGEFPYNLQPKLLRLLQEREVTPVGLARPVYVDVRFVAATNRNLVDEVRGGRFREDLFYRLNIIRLKVPPLRERPQDIPVLLSHYLAEYAGRYRCQPVNLSVGVVERLERYAWPGNVRELAALIERLYATGLDAGSLVDALVSDSTASPRSGEDLSLSQAERRAIKKALSATDNNQVQAARLLRIHRTTLHRRLKTEQD